ncbi:ABC transporter permease subunit [Gallionella capsiferriformans]|uniref:Putative ABC-2 type transport system permease protein n=1 Tax=Gallionella capsiferriformans (strain ES-2) TaxID=395494 RepID=D9SC51_GALCS|nr:ABC transporter permease subunit [Gallionella capsiferriformans]ADL54516.1 putative ABC-2 type transport system permease protein [Gallionella capsiferriformans ES-2]
MIRLIAMREIRSLLSMPSTWFVLAVLQFILAWFFLARLEAFLEIQPQLAQLANPPGVTLTVAAPLFNTAALLLMMLVPMLTMRMIAEERRNQTLTLLLSSPLSGRHIVLGKFLGLLTFLLTLLATLPLMLYTLALGTHLDHGLLLANCMGLTLLTASFIALGLYLSALTAQPIIAAAGALIILMGLWLADIGSSAADSIWHQFSPMFHFQNFNAGLLDSADAAFFVLFTSVFLLLTMKRLHNNRVYG